MQVGSLGDDQEIATTIKQTSSGMGVDKNEETAQADAAAAAAPEGAAHLAEEAAAQAGARPVNEEEGWRRQGRRGPLVEEEEEVAKFAEIAVQIVGPQAAVQQIWRELVADQPMELMAECCRHGTAPVCRSNAPSSCG